MIQHVIGIVKDLPPDVTSNGSKSDFAHRFLSEALRPIGHSDDVVELDDVELTDHAAKVLATNLPVTSGAATLIAGSRTVYRAIEVIFADKQFRAELREAARSRAVRGLAEELISSSVRLNELFRPALRPNVRPVRIQPPAAMNGNASEAIPHRRPASERTRRDVPPQPPPIDLIRSAWSQQASSEAGGRSIGDLVAGLASDDVDAESLRLLRSLTTGRHRLLLPALFRMTQSGGWQPSKAWRPFFLIEVVRVLTTLNANETAYGITSELFHKADDFDLSEGERARVANLHARAALRSGRSPEAIRIYRSVFYERLHRGEAIFNYLNAIVSVDASEALSLAMMVARSRVPLHPFEMIFVGDLLLAARRREDALAMFQRAATEDPTGCEHLVGLANLSLAKSDRASWFELLQLYGRRSGLKLDSFNDQEDLALFAFAKPAPDARGDVSEPKVSVIMTSFNSERTLLRAARSVLDQDMNDIELIIVDDVSTDGSRRLIQDLAASDGRVRHLFNDTNIGTYAAKNRGLQAARGEFVTFHDSDDWMHPRRLVRQVQETTSAVGCTTSQWLRMDAEGRVVVRRGGGYTHLNPASTLFRKSIADDIGPFDYVRTGADSEYLFRIRLRYGWNSVVSMTDCLGIGLHHDQSLTQSGITAFDEHRFSPVRLAYTEAWLDWHLDQQHRNAPVGLWSKTARPFAVPGAIDVQGA